MIQIGVIGTGGMGGRHARNLAGKTPGAEVVAVMDVDQTRAETVAAQCGGARVYTDAKALIDDQAVEAVLIASPDWTHADLALACLAADKPALCEKPLAATLAEAEKVLQAEAAKGQRFIQVGFMREYDPAHQALKARIEAGEIGRPFMFYGTHSNLGGSRPRPTEHVIIGSAVHDIHSARWLIKQEIARVYVQRVAADESQPETCRLLLAQLTFRDGSLGVIEVNVDSDYGYQVDVELTGEHGAVRTVYNAGPVVRQGLKQVQTIDSDWLERFETAYIKEVQAWVQSVATGQPTGPSVWDGYAAMVVADACVQSAKTGQPQVVPKLERPALYT